MKSIRVRLFLFFLVMATACSVSRMSGNTRTKSVKSLDDSAYELAEYTADTTYGFDVKNPVCVGRREAVRKTSGVI
jgi:hypothetical protein